MPSIHLFNPGHETAVLSGSESYTPPGNVRKMQEDLALLPLWYADSGDYVWTGKKDYMAFLASLPVAVVPRVTPVAIDNVSVLSGKQVTAMPWGLSPQGLRLFRDINQKLGASIDVPEWKEDYASLTGRQTAAACLDKIRGLLPFLHIPPTPVFCRTMAEVEQQLQWQPSPCLLKTPFSSSGRGLLWLNQKKLSGKDREWVSGALQKQGSVSIEQGLEKVQDFALEFYLNEQGKASYKGLSVFETAVKGVYTGNRLEEQESMLNELTQSIGIDMYVLIHEALTRVIQEVYGSIYTGIIGVDMMLYRNGQGEIAIHPCIEINMRYTMGMVAIRLFQQYTHPTTAGSFHISYNKHTYDEHMRMLEAFPLRLEDGRIKTGYMALCPITAETHYRAYILMEEKINERG